jgi:hypothetical protein
MKIKYKDGIKRDMKPYQKMMMMIEACPNFISITSSTWSSLRVYIIHVRFNPFYKRFS